jgi:hypothetical protein
MNGDGQNYWDPNDATEQAAGAVPSENPVPNPQVAAPQPAGIEWEASEYLQHNNGIGWYAAFFLIALVLILFAVLFRAWTFIPVIIVMAVAGIIHVRRPPRIVHYLLDDQGLSIENTLHYYGEYKSFSVIRDGAFFAIMLIPVKRFLPSTIVYFDENDGEPIVDAFGSHLAMENHDLDPVDKFLRFIRF